MSNSANYLGDLSQAELTAARNAVSLTERAAHLENAFQYAQMAVRATQCGGNIVPFSRMIAEGMGREGRA